MTEQIGLAVASEQPDELATMTEAQIDEALRHYGYDSEKVGYTGKVFAQVCIENVKLRAEVERLTNAGLECAYGETMATDEIEHWVKLATEQREVIEDLRGKLKAASNELRELRIRAEQERED